jgi:hypothetical protein
VASKSGPRDDVAIILSSVVDQILELAESSVADLECCDSDASRLALMWCRSVTIEQLERARPLIGWEIPVDESLNIFRCRLHQERGRS